MYTNSGIIKLIRDKIVLIELFVVFFRVKPNGSLIQVKQVNFR